MNYIQTFYCKIKINKSNFYLCMFHVILCTTLPTLSRSQPRRFCNQYPGRTETTNVRIHRYSNMTGVYMLNRGALSHFFSISFPHRCQIMLANWGLAGCSNVSTFSFQARPFAGITHQSRVICITVHRKDNIIVPGKTHVSSYV